MLHLNLGFMRHGPTCFSLLYSVPGLPLSEPLRVFNKWKKIPKWDYSTYGTFVRFPFKKSRNLTRKYGVMCLCCLQENYRIHGKSTQRQLPQRLCWDRSAGAMRSHTCLSPVSVSVTLQSKREDLLTMKPGQRPGAAAWRSSVKWGTVPADSATQSGPILLPPGTRRRLY